jgi:MFS family permease
MSDSRSLRRTNLDMPYPFVCNRPVLFSLRCFLLFGWTFGGLLLAAPDSTSAFHLLPTYSHSVASKRLDRPIAISVHRSEDNNYHLRKLGSTKKKALVTASTGKTTTTTTTTTTSSDPRYNAIEIMTLRSKRRDDYDDDDDDDDSNQKDETTAFSGNVNWFLALVLPLQIVYISNQWSRSSIYYLVNFSDGADPFRAMNVAIGFSEAQYGLLASLAFTALFAFASLGAGAAADRYDRKALTVFAAAGWSVATLGTAFSTTYPQVLACRIAMGLFCAFSTPTAYTLINQRVPKDRITLATSIYGTGVALGGALASLSILLDNEVGWQQALTVIAGVGFGSAAIASVFLPGDEDKGKPDVSPPSIVDNPVSAPAVGGSVSPASAFVRDVSQAVSSTRARWIFLGSFFRFCSGLCIGVWSAPYFRMAFPDNAADYAVAQALITAGAGSVSGLIGGAVADYISKAPGGEDGTMITDEIGRKLWIPVVGSILATPTWYLAVHSSGSFSSAMIWLTIEYLVAECWFGPTISALLSTVPSKIGGTAQGLFTLTGAMANFAPTVLGYIYGQASNVEAKDELLGLLSMAVCTCYLLSAASFAMGAQSPPMQTLSVKRQKGS